MGAAKQKYNSILQHFPRHIKPRDVQRSALIKLEQAWNDADVFVVNLPVASGKSAIAISIAAWQESTSIITPTKLLVNQYHEEYPYVHVLRSKADYYCTTFMCTLNKRPNPKKYGKTCKFTMGCEGCNQYTSDVRKAFSSSTVLSNYYIYMAYKLHRECLVVDEAHQLIPTLKNMARKKIWQFKYKYPSHLDTRDEIKDWVNSLPDEAFTYSYGMDGIKRYSEQTLLLKLKEELNSRRPRFLVRTDTDQYKDYPDEPLIYMEPLDISDEPPFLWPESVQKMVLMSATISRKDIEQLGLAGKKVKYIQADSPITAEKRPVYVPAHAESMAYRHQVENVPKLIEFLKVAAAENREHKGLVHATYSLARKIQGYIKKHEPELDKRILYHDQDNKADQYQAFRDTDEPKILIASGMYEGIDLPYDAGRWQVIAKVPWPSLADPAIKYMANLDKEYYAWETIKTVLQACGRICRTPTDYGETLVFDSTFKRLYRENPEFFPDWFKNSVTIYEEEE